MFTLFSSSHHHFIVISSLKTLERNPFFLSAKTQSMYIRFKHWNMSRCIFMFSCGEGFYNGGGFVFVDFEKICDFGC